MKKSKTIVKNFKFIYPIFAVLLIFGLKVPNVNAQNLIFNPGFENNTLGTGCYTNQSASFVSSSLNNVTAFYGGTQDGIDIGVNDPCYAGGANSEKKKKIELNSKKLNIEVVQITENNKNFDTVIVCGKDYKNLGIFKKNIGIRVEIKNGRIKTMERKSDTLKENLK